MPLEVIKVDFGKQESIFEKFAPFVQKLVDSYKQSQQNRWDNEWMLTALQDIETAGNKEDIDAYIFRKDPPEEFLDIKGMTDFAGEAMGLLMQKEIMTGGLTPTVTPKEVKEPSAVEIVPDVKEFNELYKFVSELPTGKVDWTNTLDMFKQRLEKNRAMGSAAQQFLSMIMGQMQPTDQRAKFEQDYGLAKDIKSTLYPGEKAPASDYERWMADKESFEEFKGIGKKVFDYEKFLKENQDWEIKTITSAGNVSVGRKDTTKKWEFDTWEEAKAWTNNHPQEGYDWKIETKLEGFDVTAMKKSATASGRPNMQNFLFGDTGIINDDIKGLIDSGMPLEEEDKTLVIANYKLRKHTLTEAEIKEVELIFEQIGIPLEEKHEVVLPGGPQSTPKGPITKWTENVKSNILGIQGLFAKDEKKKDKYGYTPGEIREVNGKKYKYMGNDEWQPL